MRTMFVLVLLAGIALSPLVAASFDGDLVFSRSWAGPTVAPGGGTLATFVVPEGYTTVYGAVVDRHIFVGGASVGNWWLLHAPSGQETVLNADSGTGIDLFACTAVECHNVPGGPGTRGNDMTAEPGVWAIRYAGATTLGYTIEVRAR